MDESERTEARALDFRKSFLLTRFVVGVIGLALPLVLVVTYAVTSHGVLPALSDYYHSPLRDWFVGSMWAIGAGLLVYMADRENIADFWISTAAGTCAFAVALLPTNRTSEPVTVVSLIHLTCAIVMMSLLAVISWRFGGRDGKRPDRSARSQRRWRRLHRACAVIIAVAIAAALLCVLLDVFAVWVVLAAESLAVIAFGVSWLTKGSEYFRMIAIPPALQRSPVRTPESTVSADR